VPVRPSFSQPRIGSYYNVVSYAFLFVVGAGSKSSVLLAYAGSRALFTSALGSETHVLSWLLTEYEQN